MFKYTKSAVNDTFDLIKRLIFVFQIIIQVIYLGYITYRMYSNTGNQIFNIILLVLSSLYLIYYIFSSNEFYTNKQIVIRKRVKLIFKATKYMINLSVIILTILSFRDINVNLGNDNIPLVMLILMIFGLFLSIVFDIIILLIDNQIYIIESALKYDMEIFRTNRSMSTKLLKSIVKIDLEEMFPKVEDSKVREKIKEINYKQEQKSHRKIDFHRKNKNRRFDLE